ncbi:hypothetical protein QMK33_06745 [Hymenobacter sp. H14-R3]|uniref:DUF6577 family protein n=1 Tax=Hymenobacter sp. H14-R3 TaxID=3046308 RepID=UPI0024BB61F8|nr:DUF6577 family protein [Hymenobacter sp. H14-R3]MDJ0364845.1 hypothetical protein [Hymenobacter sp. H14-R3]
MSTLSQSAPASLNWPALQAAFADRTDFTRAEVLAFYHHADASLNPNTLDSRIRQLLQRRLLLAVSRGRYTLAAAASIRPAFQPTLGRSERTLWRTLVKELHLPKGCLWSTAWANEFSGHQAFRSLLLVEVPRDYVQAVFYALKDRYPHRVFLRPQPDMLTYYIAEADHPIVVLPLVSRAPVQLVDGVPVPRLEKLLVDLFSRPDLFPAYQGHELQTIFTNARRLYRLDERTLLCYAQRRHHADDLREFLCKLPG